MIPTRLIRGPKSTARSDGDGALRVSFHSHPMAHACYSASRCRRGAAKLSLGHRSVWWTDRSLETAEEEE